MIDYQEKHMRRALSLAERGFGHTVPNPMVGAVIVSADGRIIGEGWHRHCGQGHAEVNAVASVQAEDRPFLTDATMYVTLEPCSHYGKTPPCAKLIIDTGIPRVVVGALDPFKAVSGRGIHMLREAGVEVLTGVMADESRALNAMFITAHENARPWVTLKWAQTADGYIDRLRDPVESPLTISTPLTQTAAHRLRAAHDGIMVGSGTILADHPSLNVRRWPATSPRPIVLDRRGRLTQDDLSTLQNPLVCGDYKDIPALLERLYQEGLTAVLVEGGAQVLNSFLEAGIYDMLHVEISDKKLDTQGIKAPTLDKLPTTPGIHTIAANPLLRPGHPLMTDAGLR